MRREDWAEVVAEYQQSGKTQKDFAEEKGLVVATLQSWIYRAKRSGGGVKLLPVRVKEAARAERQLEVELGGGARLRFEEGTDCGYVAALVKALLC